MSDLPDQTVRNCANCRHHATEQRWDVLGDAPLYDTIIETADEDVRIYHCRAPAGPYARKEVGREPVHCPSWSEPVRSGSKEVDEAFARAEARLAERAKTRAERE